MPAEPGREARGAGTERAPFHLGKRGEHPTEQTPLRERGLLNYFESLGTWQPEQGGDGGAVRQGGSKSWGGKP